MLDLIRAEPAITRGLIALIGVIAAYLGLDLPADVVTTAVVALGFASVATRQVVTPVVPDPDPQDHADLSIPPEDV